MKKILKFREYRSWREEKEYRRKKKRGNRFRKKYSETFEMSETYGRSNEARSS